MRYGLIGEKLGHSFSKVIHEKLCAYEYELLPMPPEAVGPFLTRREFSGINVTIPYKETVLPYLSYIDPVAREIGAVNTIVQRDGLLYGYNTDAAGLTDLLQSNGFDPRGRTALVLGSGGTSKTACAVLRRLGAEKVLVVSRRPHGENQISYEQAISNYGDAQCLINTTPVGMYPQIELSPLDLAAFPRLAFVADVIYNPLRTPLLQQAAELRIPNANGLRMLVAQARAAAERFLDVRIPPSETERVLKALNLEMRSLALIGMPSCGKTTLGKMLAQRLGRELVDLDEKIARDAGCSIPKIFAREGETGFRARETQALRQVAGRQGLVIATGGGIVKRPDNVRLLRANALLCFVERDVRLLQAEDPSRPLSTSREALRRMYEERLPLYRAAADFTAHNDGRTEDAARTIETTFKEMCR